MRTREIGSVPSQVIKYAKGVFFSSLACAVMLTPPMHASAQSAPAPTSTAQAAKLDDPTIVAIFDAANSWDMETGRLAAKKGHDRTVRAFGRMIAHDHSVFRQQGRDLAQKLGVHPTPPKPFAMYTDHRAAVKKLRGLRGEAFDTAFLAHEVAYHKAVIDAVTNTLLPAIQNTELKALVVKVAPAFQAHMVKAQQLLAAEGKESHS